MSIIRELRLERGWSQEDLAEIAGLSTRTIQRLENGGRASLETLKCLAAVFESDISSLRENMDMNTTTDHTTNADTGAGHRASDCLSAEDRAALQFARQLRAYAELESDDMPEKMAIRQQVRKERAFYIHTGVFAAVMALLFVIDYLTSPGRYWVQWPLLGWGAGLLWHGLSVFRGVSFGKDWERRQVEERLACLAESGAENKR